MKHGDGSTNILNSIWKFFASVKLTVIVLLSLALTSVIGTLIPQNAEPDAYRRAFGEYLFRLFTILDIFDMYHSWWFQLLLILLMLNVLVCSIERLSTTWKVIFTKEPSFRVSRFRGMSDKIELGLKLAPEKLKERLLPLVGSSFSYHRLETGDKGFVVFAEKLRWTRLGPYVVHCSVILLLIGGLVGSIFGFEGFVNIPEGEAVDTIRLRHNQQPLQLPFAIRCDDFAVSYYDDQRRMPKEYRSSLTILEQDKVRLSKDIIVNDPLRYNGINIFQSSYGEMPPAAGSVNLPDEFSLKFTSKASGKVYRQKAALGRVIELPEGLGQFTPQELKPNFDFMGQDLGQTLVGQLDLGDGAPVEVALPLRFPNFDKMAPRLNPQRKGQLFIAFDKLPVPKEIEKRFYTGLQVTRDPGVGIVYTGFVVMILGCFITFFLSHQRLCVEVTFGNQSSRVMLAGSANKNKLGMQRKVEKLAQQLSQLGDVP